MRRALPAGLLVLLLAVAGGAEASAQAAPATTAATGPSKGFDNWGLLGLLGLAGLAGAVRTGAGSVRERRRLRKEARNGPSETAFDKLRAEEAQRVATDAEERKSRARPQAPAYPAWSTASNATSERPPVATTPEPESRPRNPRSTNGSVRSPTP